MRTAKPNRRPTPPAAIDETRATARLPGLDIQIRHRRAAGAEREELTISLVARPSFEAFSRAVDAGNPFAFWTQAMGLAWSIWAPLPFAPPALEPLMLAPPQKDAAAEAATTREPPRRRALPLPPR